MITYSVIGICIYVFCSYIITGLGIRYLKDGVEQCKDEKVALGMFIASPISVIALIIVFSSWLISCIFYYPFTWITGIKL